MQLLPMAELMDVECPTLSDRDCCFCRGSSGLLIATSGKGLETLDILASSRNDQPLLNAIKNQQAALMYHHKCYVYYKRKSADNKENKEQTPLRELQCGAPRRKITRLSPKQYDENLCIVCQTKGWVKGKLHTYEGNIQKWMDKVSSNNDLLLDRLSCATQNKTKVFYHKTCSLSRTSKARSDGGKLVGAFTDCFNVPSINHVPESILTNSDVYLKKAANLIRHDIKELAKGLPIIPSCDAAKASVPRSLKTFLFSLFGCENEDRDFSNPHALSIAQDIMYALEKIRTPKHISLASTLRKLTGSKKVISLMADLGHCVTYIDCLRAETSAANQVLHSFINTKVYIPANITKGKFVFGAVDNIDFGNSSPDGKGTTHATNLILYQPGDSSGPYNSSIPETVSTNKSLQLLTTNLYEHIDTSQMKYPSKTVPNPNASHEISPISVSSHHANSSIEITHQWVVDRKESNSAPTWYAYNGRLVPESKQTKLAYLPMLNEPSTDSKAVYKAIKIMQMTMTELHQAPVVIYMDQAMYSLGQQVLWANKKEFENVVPMMGGFHLAMNFLSAIGAMFGNLGWTDLLVDADVFSAKVAENLVDCKPYDRCLEAHMAVYEAISRVKLDVFEEWCQSQPGGSISEFTSARCQSSVQFHFWNMYLESVEIVLTQLYAERTGDWQLYVSTIRNMIPYFFATDRVKYSRWLSVHLNDLMSLPSKWPDLQEQFLAGNFVVNRSANRFSSVSPDQALEQSLNREVKCNGGLIGNTTNENSRNRWFLTSHIKATMSAELDRMREKVRVDPKQPTFSHHTDNKGDQLKSTVWPNKVYNHININQIRPFGEPTSTQICNPVTGKQMSVDETGAICGSLRKAKRMAEEFMEKCVRCGNDNSLYETIKKMNIPFKPKKKAKTKQISSKTTESQDIRRLSQLAIVASARNLPVEDLICEDNGLYPPTLCLPDGEMRKPDKSQLRKCIEQNLATVQFPDEASVDCELSSFLVDGIAAIYRYKPVVETFAEYGRQLYGKLVTLMRANGCNRMDVVFDRYKKKSLKQWERERRSSNTKPHAVIKISRDRTKIPVRWYDYLSICENKTNLVMFLTTLARDQAIRNLLHADEGIVCVGEHETIMISNTVAAPILDANNNHEEADTLIIWQIKQQLETKKRFVVYSEDTDVMVLLIHFVHKWGIPSLRVYMLTGPSNSFKSLPIHSAVDHIGSKVTNLVGLHCLTGCDTVNAIFGVSKSKAFKKILHRQALGELGESGSSPSRDSMCALLYDLYGQTSFEGSMKQLRFKLIAERNLYGKSLPPTDEVLAAHTARANYQAYLWKQADCQTVDKPDPSFHGWVDTVEGLRPEYGVITPSTNYIVSCGCSGKCVTKHCTCRRSSVVCTDLCRCGDECCNVSSGST